MRHDHLGPGADHTVVPLADLVGEVRRRGHGGHHVDRSLEGRVVGGLAQGTEHVAAAERLERQLDLLTGLNHLRGVRHLRVVAEQVAVEHDAHVGRVQVDAVVPQTVLQRWHPPGLDLIRSLQLVEGAVHQHDGETVTQRAKFARHLQSVKEPPARLQRRYLPKFSQ